MTTRKAMCWQALLACAGMTAAGLAGANTVAATATPLPNQTLTITTVAATTTTATQVQPRGTAVQLQATATPGYQFMGWGSSCSGTVPTCTVTLNGDRSVVARFYPVLTVAVTGPGSVVATSGGINCGTDCTEPYLAGSNIALTATAQAGQVFTGWGGACTGTARTCTVNMAGLRNVTASFGPAQVPQYTLGVSVTGAGSVSSTPAGISCGSDCSEAYASGTSVTLVATPATGQVFSGWGGACTGTGTCTLSMTAARSVTAAFAAAPPPPPAGPFTLSVAVSGNGAVGSAPAGILCGADCSEAYPSGTSVTLAAAPAAGQTFTGWGGACAGTASTCTVSMSQARSVSASFSAVVSSGPVYYFSDCQVGAAAGCVPGDNANPGTTEALPKRTLVGFDVNTLPAGARVLFKRGGAWDGFSMQVENPNATSAAPLVFDAYGTGPAPWLRVTGGYGIQFGRYGSMAVDGGYVLRNLRLDGSGATGERWGIHLRFQTRDVLIEGNEVHGFWNGLMFGNEGETGQLRLTIRNNHIHHNRDMGILGAANDLVIEGNRFEQNNDGSNNFYGHAIYLGGIGRNGVIRNNTFVNNSSSTGTCNSGNLTVHGLWDTVLIENNTITVPSWTGSCYGISITAGYANTAEAFRNFVVRNNTLVNLGCGICVNTAPGIVVESNRVFNTLSSWTMGVSVPAHAAEAVDTPTSDAVVRNNTVCYNNPAPGSTPFVTTAASVATGNVYRTGADATTGPCAR